MTVTVEEADRILANTLIIDCDSHITEPPDLWESRVPAAMKTRVQRCAALMMAFRLGFWMTNHGLELAGTLSDWIGKRFSVETQFNRLSPSINQLGMPRSALN